MNGVTRVLRLLLLGLLSQLLLCELSVAQEDLIQTAQVVGPGAVSEEGGPPSSGVSMPLLAYVPPRPVQPVPSGRTAPGGTRGPESGFPTVTLLVPEHVGLTVLAQPELYWHISESTRRPVVFTLISDEAVLPIVERRLDGPVGRGIHVIRLSDDDIRLKTGILYEWSVTILANPQAPSAGDSVAKGFIKRIQPSDALVAVPKGDPLSAGIRFAHNHVWYDALMALSRQEDMPRAARAQLDAAREDLFRAVKLTHTLAGH